MGAYIVIGIVVGLIVGGVAAYFYATSNNNQKVAEANARIEAAEAYLHGLGFSQLRVRNHGNLARIEVPSDDIDRASELHDEIAKTLKMLGFAYVALDLQGFRSGSMNEVL